MRGLPPEPATVEAPPPKPRKLTNWRAKNQASRRRGQADARADAMRQIAAAHRPQPTPTVHGFDLSQAGRVRISDIAFQGPGGPNVQMGGLLAGPDTTLERTAWIDFATGVVVPHNANLRSRQNWFDNAAEDIANYGSVDDEGSSFGSGSSRESG